MNQRLWQQDGWGGAHCSLAFPALKIRFTSLSVSQRERILSLFHGFASDHPLTDNDVVCHACRLEKPLEVDIQQFMNGGTYGPRRLGEGAAAHLSFMGFDFVAEVVSDRQPAWSCLATAEEQQLGSASVVENYLRMLTAHWVLHQQGVLLHSAGLVFDGRAYVFPGYSNAGKTTLTRKAHEAGATVLSDDINLVLPQDGAYRAFAVPFTGEFGRTLQHAGGQASYPLQGMVLLEQAKELSVTPVGKAQAVAALLTACPFVNNDEQVADELFDVVTALVDAVPVLRLRNRRDDSIQAIMEQVEQGFARLQGTTDMAPQEVGLV